MSVEVLKNVEASTYYNEIKALSYSTLSNNYLNTSEAGSIRAFKSTDDIRFGRSFHHVWLHRLIGKEVSLDVHEIDRKTKAGKELAEYLEKSNIEWFKPGEKEQCDFMCNAFFASVEQDEEQKQIIQLFRDHGMIELTILWVNEQGLKFKSRLDATVLDHTIGTAYVLDLKTDGKLNAEKLYWKYRDFDYDLQKYIYCRALIAAGYTKIKYFTLSIDTDTAEYCFSLYGDYDFSYENSYKNYSFESGEKKYTEALINYHRIQQKLKSKIPLSYSVKPGIQLLSHPAYEQET